MLDKSIIAALIGAGATISAIIVKDYLDRRATARRAADQPVPFGGDPGLSRIEAEARLLKTKHDIELLREQRRVRRVAAITPVWDVLVAILGGILKLIYYAGCVFIAWWVLHKVLVGFSIAVNYIFSLAAGLF